MTPEEEQWVRDRLAAEPPAVMPRAVRERLNAALAAESQRRLASPPQQRRPPSRRPWFAVAAAAAVVVLAGVVVLPQLSRDTPSASTASVPDSAPESTQPAVGSAGPAACEVTARAGADLQPVMVATGTSYTRAELGVQAQSLLTQPRACGGMTVRQPSPAWDTSVEALSRCVVAVAAGRPVMVVDTGWYEQKPAVVALIKMPPTRAVVIDCAQHPVEVLQDVAVE